MPALLEIDDLATYFYTETGIVRAVDGVSFDIKRGEIVGMLGESGCGKSVTGYSILHLINAPGKIVGGQMLFHRGENDVIDLLKFDPRCEEIRQIRGRDIAMVFQEPMTAFDPLFTVGDQVVEALLVHEKVTKKSRKKLSLFVTCCFGCVSAGLLFVCFVTVGSVIFLIRGSKTPYVTPLS